MKSHYKLYVITMEIENTIQTQDNIIVHLKNWIQSKYNIKIDNKDKYIERANINSFDIINFVIYIESTYNISFSTNDFQDNRFFTLQGLSKIIIQKIRDK